MLGRNDDPTEIEGYNGEEDLGLFGLARAGIDNDAVHRAQNIDRMVDADLYRTGLHRRKLLLELHEIENNYMYTGLPKVTVTTINPMFYIFLHF